MWIFWVSEFIPSINFESFNYSFAEVNVDVSNYNSCKFIVVKAGINGSNENII